MCYEIRIKESVDSFCHKLLNVLYDLVDILGKSLNISNKLNALK